MKSSKIKNLEYELGRYKKKVQDQEREITRLKGNLELANRGNRETQLMMDAILAAVAVKYGEKAVDPDDPEKVLGQRLTLPFFDLYEIQKSYEVHARKDETSCAYIIGVVERDK